MPRKKELGLPLKFSKFNAAKPNKEAGVSAVDRAATLATAIV
jgi:hypothetical protein